MENIYLIRKTVQHMAQLLETLVRQQCAHRNRCRVVSAGEPLPGGPEADEASADRLEEHHLMTIKEAMAFIPVSRTKLYEMRKEGMLDTIERNSRQKRLLRTQVEAARTWSRNKGKW